ncbi:MAG: hypothetical protein J1F64_06120 [Oscillospiraceae bacterium]|nr:hypothetical protein [Oscillospiraceae bacterium]
MKNLKKAVISISLIAALSLSAAQSCFAADASQFATDTPPYSDTEDQAQKAETSALYSARPFILKQAEYLKRGTVAVKADEGVLVSWRFKGTDDPSTSFNVYRDGKKIAHTERTCFLDANGTDGSVYYVLPVLNGNEVDEDKTEASVLTKGYLSIPVKQYEKGDYDINDASVGDLDGDGEYEIVVRRNPADMELATRVAYPLVEAYRLDGTHMWTIDIGPNEICDIDINILVYDFDGDGKAEVVLRSFEGTVDGAGNKIGDENGDGKENYEYSIQKFPDRQYLSEGPEFLSVYEGATGKETARCDLVPKRDPLSSWSSAYPDVARLTKRASHYLFAAAYLNGETPSIVLLRGAWDGVKLAAWDYKNGKITELWQYDSSPDSRPDNLYGAGYHSLAVADIDFDGKDEILSGAGAIDDNGKFMYATHANNVKLGHGDAFDVAKMDPNFDGYYIWACHETKNLPANIDLHDARTGQVLFGYSKPKDTGRSRAADIDPTSEGWEVWGSTGTPLQSYKGVELAGWNVHFRDANGNIVTNKDAGIEPTEEIKAEDPAELTVPMNMKMYWDGDLLSELVDHVTVYKWNWENKEVDILWEDTECASNGGTKGQNVLTADIFGDWREEIIFRTADNKEMRIYSTDIPTDYRMPSLIHDITYREAVAWQNNHYNQPTNTSFYFGAETTKVPVPAIYTQNGSSKEVNPVYASDKTYKDMDILVTKEDELFDKAGDSDAVVLKIGSPNAINGDTVSVIDPDNTSVTPIIVNDRTLVPIRYISEAFGARVDWNAETRTADITKGNDKVSITVDADKFIVNGAEKELDSPAVIYEGRTMVPIRAVLEAFGKKLYWDDGIIVISDSDEAPAADLLDAWKNSL